MSARCIRPRLSAAVLVSVVSLAGTGAFAQYGPPSKAFDRLFAPDPSEERSRVSLFVYEGVDSVKDQGEQASNATDGAFTGLTPTASFSAGRGHTRLTVNGGGAFRDYTGASSLALLSAGGTLDLRFAGRRSGVRLYQSTGYAPYYDFLDTSQISLNDTDASGVPSPDRAAFDRSLTSSRTEVEVGRQLTRRLLVSAAGELRYSHLAAPSAPTDARLRDPWQISGQIELRQQLDRYTVLVAGYGMRSLRTVESGVAPIRSQDLLFGVDRSQQFALLRRAVLQVSGGSSIVSVTDGRRILLTGNAAFRYDLSRTWSASVSASRDLDYVEVLPDPVVSDTFAIAVGGFVGPRIDLRATGGYVLGDVGLGPQAPGFHEFTGSVRVRALVTSSVAAYLEWTDYEHWFGEAIPLPDTFVRQRIRSGLRVGVIVSHAVRQPQDRGDQ